MPEDNQSQDDFSSNFISGISSTPDSTAPGAAPIKIPVRSKPRGLKSKLADIWVNPKKRKLTLASLLILIALLIIVPSSRYFMLNTVGVRSSASVKVLDESTGQPLRNVTIKVANAEAQTNEDGVAWLNHLRLGQAQLVIKKRAFAETSRSITLGWGSNPLGDFSLRPVGLQYKFRAKDFLSGQPVEKVEASSGEFSAFSDSEGLVVLTIEDPKDGVIDIALEAEGYRKEVISQPVENKENQDVGLVPSRKHIFVSKRSGKFDVYSVDLDGRDEKLVLSGTGNERDDMVLVPHPEQDVAALVSTRDSVRNRDGFLLSTLTLLDLNDDVVTTESIVRSERAQIVGWAGDQLVYVRIADGASGDTPDRHRLVTYNIKNGQSQQIAQSNYFNDVFMVGGDIFYAPSSAYQPSGVGLHKVKANGEDDEVVFEQEVWSILRTDYDSLMFSVHDHWYEYSLKDNRVLAASGPPPSRITRIYADNNDRSQSLWVDRRDGRGVLISHNPEANDEKIVSTQSGLVYPVRWMSDDSVVYRINTDQETADYVVSLSGGEARKIVDVTNIGSVERWYYY